MKYSLALEVILSYFNIVLLMFTTYIQTHWLTRYSHLHPRSRAAPACGEILHLTGRMCLTTVTKEWLDNGHAENWLSKWSIHQPLIWHQFCTAAWQQILFQKCALIAGNNWHFHTSGKRVQTVVHVTENTHVMTDCWHIKVWIYSVRNETWLPTQGGQISSLRLQLR